MSHVFRLSRTEARRRWRREEKKKKKGRELAPDLRIGSEHHQGKKKARGAARPRTSCLLLPPSFPWEQIRQVCGFHNQLGAHKKQAETKKKKSSRPWATEARAFRGWWWWWSPPLLPALSALAGSNPRGFFLSLAMLLFFFFSLTGGPRVPKWHEGSRTDTVAKGNTVIIP